MVQKFVPASKRGWITGVTTTMLPAGFILGALLGQYAEAYAPADPRLGSRIAALADPRGPP